MIILMGGRASIDVIDMVEEGLIAIGGPVK